MVAKNFGRPVGKRRYLSDEEDTLKPRFMPANKSTAAIKPRSLPLTPGTQKAPGLQRVPPGLQKIPPGLAKKVNNVASNGVTLKQNSQSDYDKEAILRRLRRTKRF